MEARLAANDRERILELFLQEVVHLDAVEIARRRADQSWRKRLAMAHTVVREFAIDRKVDPAPFRDLAVPVLLLLGQRSRAQFRAATAALAAALPDARIVVLPDMGHTWLDAPEVLARHLIAFLG